MAYHWCVRCEAHHGRVCLPAWIVRAADDDSAFDPKPIHASDAGEAAEKWAERDDSYGDYSIVGGNEIEVLVRPYDEPDAKPLRFRVTGESVPTYTADEIEDTGTGRGEGGEHG